MRIVPARSDTGLRWGVLADDDRLIPVPARTVEELTDWLADGDRSHADDPSLERRSTDPPVDPGKIVGVGLNYRDHAAEVGEALPADPLLFLKPGKSAIGPGAPVRVDPSITTFPDWEVELAVVVGRRMRSVSVERALDHVLGYTVANDVTARDIQQADGQWFRAKSIRTFCPLGPCIVTPDELGDPQALALATWVNGERMQRSTTAQMCFSVAELLAFCSRHFDLDPGDVLLTGTPPGVGMSMVPPRALSAGDVVEVEVEGIGRMANPVEAVEPGHDHHGGDR